jgi:hypothetical protein
MLRSDGPKALPPEGKGAPRSIAQQLPDSCGRPRSTPGARGTGRLQSRVASATNSTIATVEPASTRGCAEATTTRRGGHYDSEEDRSPSLEPPCPQAFSRAIRRAPFLARFRAPTTITKYSGETRPELWLADYRLACQLGGTDDDNLIIRNLPCSSSTLPGPGWSICLLHRSPTRTTWSKPSLEISRARTCALGTRGISEAAASSQGNPCESTSDGFQSSAPSCLTSPTRMSLVHSSTAPRAETW